MTRSKLLILLITVGIVIGLGTLFGTKIVLAATYIVKVIGDDLQICPVAGCALSPTVGNGGDTILEGKLGVNVLPTEKLSMSGGRLFLASPSIFDQHTVGDGIKIGHASTTGWGANAICMGSGTDTEGCVGAISSTIYFGLPTSPTTMAVALAIPWNGTAWMSPRNTSTDFQINNTGLIGMGRAPATELDVNITANNGTYADTNAIRFWDGGNGWQIGENASAFFQLWRVTAGAISAPYLTVDATGKLGIGTATPTYAIHATGDIYANGGWFRVSGPQGLYWETQGTRIWAPSANYISIGANDGIILTDSSGGTIRGYIYTDNCCAFGLLNNGASWVWRGTFNTTNMVFSGAISGTTSVKGVDAKAIVARRYEDNLVRAPIFSTTSSAFVVTGSATNPYVHLSYSWPAALSGTLRRYQVDVAWSNTGTASNQGCVTRVLNNSSLAYYPGTGDVNMGYIWANATWDYNTRILNNGTTDTANYRVDAYQQLGPSFTCWIFGTDFIAEDTVNGSDYAEQTESYQELLKGQIVSIDTQHDTAIVVSQKPYQPDVAGVVSTEPGITIGKVKVGGKPFPMALSGRVPTNMSTINGPIHRGDIITTSSLQGIGMKATKAGATVGKAYEEFDCQSVTNCTDINKVKYWVDNQSQKVDPTKATSKIYPVAQITMLLNLSWYDPDVYLTSIAGFDIKFTGDVAHVFNAAGEQIDRVGIFGDAIIAHLKAGVIEVKTLVLDGKDLNTQITTLKTRTSTLEQEVKTLQTQGKAQ